MPIQDAGLSVVGEARDGRLDVNMLNAVAISVMLDTEDWICGLEGLASEPTDALEGEDRVRVIAERLVLRGCQH